LLGRRSAAVLLGAIATVYAVLDREVRHASAAYLGRLYPRVSWWMIRRHVTTFAQCTLDRFLVLDRQFESFRVTSTGLDYLREVAASGRGALLIGAHLGSFEAARAVGDEQSLPINVLVHSANARQINRFLAAVNPKLRQRVIEIDSEEGNYIFRVSEALERGELVALLGDRVGLNERSATVDFLGRPARFPTGPYALAAALGCPVYLTFGLYHRPNRYNLYCEPFADRIVLPRRGRKEALEHHAQRFAERLEFYCRLAPYNWFNFFDFWG
jgi:predicted LPLAT superfamily acyltransferase